MCVTTISLVNKPSQLSKVVEQVLSLSAYLHAGWFSFFCEKIAKHFFREKNNNKYKLAKQCVLITIKQLLKV